MRDLEWVGSSQRDLRAFPSEVRRAMGFALRIAQEGGKHPNAKPLKGYHGAGVLEIVEDDDGDTYRAMYTISLPDAVYVLHAFKKKSKQGKATPKQAIDLINARLTIARRLSATRINAGE
ncbi:MAG: type II toxin-antitoxin system RelE/ParE family toxin [Chloroflexota bacterium]|nr:type II toxin-antitoxin system RelE/ParE family toxin [Chloroflexota bacterium]